MNKLLTIIIIIIHFYIPRNLSSEAQQNRIIKHIREVGRAKVIIRTRDNRQFMVEIQFGINMSRDFLEDRCSFRCFQSDGQFIPDRSNKERMFAQDKRCFSNNKL